MIMKRMKNLIIKIEISPLPFSFFLNSFTLSYSLSLLLNYYSIQLMIFCKERKNFLFPPSALRCGSAFTTPDHRFSKKKEEEGKELILNVIN